MTRVLIAGVGNIFFGDDGFGVEVARRLVDDPPPGARVGDFGIRSIHLVYELLEPVDVCIIADCMPRGAAPGTLYVLEPDPGRAEESVANAHGMDLSVVFAAVQDLAGRMPLTRVVGCEPATTEPGIGLSSSVTEAVPAAIALIRDLAATLSQERNR